MSSEQSGSLDKKLSSKEKKEQKKQKKDEEKQRKEEEKARKEKEKDEKRQQKLLEKQAKQGSKHTHLSQSQSQPVDKSHRRFTIFSFKKSSKSLKKSLTPELSPTSPQQPQAPPLSLPMSPSMASPDTRAEILSASERTDLSHTTTQQTDFILPSDVLKQILAITTTLEKVFNFTVFREELDSFRLLNITQIQFMGKDMYLRTLPDVINLLPLIYNKEYTRQLLFYSHEFEPEKILFLLVESFLKTLDGNKPQREKYCSNCIRVFTAWFTTRDDVFTNSSLLELSRNFLVFCRKQAQKESFLGEPLDEAERCLEEVFTSKGIVTFKKRLVVDQEKKDELFDVITVMDERCFNMIPEQLALVEFDFLTKLNPHDYYVYLDNDTKVTSKVNGYIFWHDLLTHWFVYEIVRQKTVEDRYKCIQTLFKLSLGLIRKKNINSLTALVDSFDHQAVRRLAKTWEKLTKEEWGIYSDLKSVRNNIAKKNASITLPPPCVPDFRLLIKVLL
ncbi:hypothetical protein EIN_251160 [Entamoeba invadens IP1]|uniref:Ras-GEF domain-containing protein n=1 Tax=Entamoeba invadens IP1 TaxID=370355 RepID=A0A0A1UHA3_ENTIV|nr:hypothetical protein EIN_251160 [Entamoeba invadens IP1]ELP94972.1 hypothetical protein EIN_251160 [Entamoeba invadens IP1]|eukprot:XP_004261743.1 hypothetical protein EIN_251160 [Entamoeba invadens IP1]